MKRIYNDLSFVATEKIEEQVAEILCRDDFCVELFGVSYYAQELPDNYSIVDYGSRETLAICIDGEVITDRDEIASYEEDMAWC